MTVRVLVFDVFGALLDWRTRIAEKFRECGVPGELMSVVAHPWDLDGARSAGLRTAYVARPLEYRPDSAPHPQPQADLSVSDLPELAHPLRNTLHG